MQVLSNFETRYMNQLYLVWKKKFRFLKIEQKLTELREQEDKNAIVLETKGATQF